MIKLNKEKEMKDIMQFIAFVVLAFIMLGVTIFSFGVFVDYWNGTARASLIKKQTGIEYTWR